MLVLSLFLDLLVLDQDYLVILFLLVVVDLVVMIMAAVVPVVRL